MRHKTAATTIHPIAPAMPAATTTATTPACLCGCGGRPKGEHARYLPGHDSKHRSVMSAVAGPPPIRICLCGCGVATRGGRFRPGHDARWYAASKRAAKAETDDATRRERFYAAFGVAAA